MISRLKSKLLTSNDHMTAGRFSYGCPKVLTFPSGGRLEVGSFCSIADEVTILLGGNHNDRAVTTYPLNALFQSDDLPVHELTKGDVVIGHDVWVGYGVLILSGVRIGDGAVVGANAVVTKDVPAYAVIAGNPAEIVRYRFPPEVIEAVRASRWWDWPAEKIRERAAELMSDALDFAMEGVRA